MNTETDIQNDIAEIESFRAELAIELGNDATPTALDAGVQKLAQSMAVDLEDTARALNGYMSAVDSLNARAYAIRKRYLK